jgi:hypothetical protein
LLVIVGRLRTRYYQEAREAVYSGPTFLLSYLLSSLPITAITTCAAALILFRSALRTYIGLLRPPDPMEGPFLLSYLLSSLPITAIATCAAALILCRSA